MVIEWEREESEWGVREEGVVSERREGIMGSEWEKRWTRERGGGGREGIEW